MCDVACSNVQVNRYIRKNLFSAEPFIYKCAIWPTLLSSYHDRTVEFTYPPVSTYNWNYLDNLISGYQEQLTENLRFWRARYILIPLEQMPQSFSSSCDNLDDEEERLAGFKKFIDLFEKQRVKMESRTAKQSRIEIIYTTYSLSSYFKNVLIQPYTQYHSLENELLTKGTHISIIAKQLQSTDGVPIHDRTWHFRRYEQVFVGEECVDWLISRFSDIETRESAVEFGNALLHQGVFKHIYSKHQFLDGFYFYRMSEEAQKKGPSSYGPNIIERTSNQASKQILLDMDPHKRSTRKEIAVLHYDSTHNPNNCYHFQIHWIVCTARLIEDSLNVWTRAAEKYGLKIVEAPADQQEIQSGDPFQSIIPIYLALPPPAHNYNDQPQYFHAELCKKFNFIMDVERDSLNLKFSYPRKSFIYTQYVHRSGVAFIQIQGDSFVFVNNRLHLANQTLRNTTYPDPNSIRNEFAKFCVDKVALQMFWDEHLLKLKGLMASL